MLNRRPARPSAGEVLALVANLPQRQREVIVLRHVADLKEAEIGEVLGICVRQSPPPCATHMHKSD